MTVHGRRELLAGMVLGVLLFPAMPAWGQPPGSTPPIYAQRLRIPVRGDDFVQPRAVVADLHTGEIFVCDSLRNRVVIFDQKGRFRYQIPGGSAFQAPIDLAVDPQGYLFVLGQVSSDMAPLDFDGRLIRKIPLSGLPEDAAETTWLVSLAISSSGDRLYLMDAANHRVWIANREGLVQAQVDLRVGRSEEEIQDLRYGHVDVYGGTVLVPIPSDGLVHLFDLEGRALGTAGSPGAAECQTMFPAAAALDDQGRLIILDQQRALFMTWDLARGVCLTEHYGFGNAPGAFYQPSDLALDPAGRLYVSQGFEGRIQVYEGAHPASTRLAAQPPSPPGVVGEVPAAGTPGEAAAAAAPESPLVPVASEPPSETDLLAALEQTVLEWAEAWSSQQIDEYLGFYSEAFQTGRDFSRGEWERLRRIRLDRPRSIRVSLAQVAVRLTAEDQAEATFVQTYRSNLFADKVDKILILRREETGWKILAERVTRTYRE